MKKMVIFCLMLFFCGGCGVEMTEKNVSKAHFVKAELEIEDKTPEERALIIKNRLKQIGGVVGTAVIVEGHTAIIGLRLEENMAQNEIAYIKKETDIVAKGADVSIESTSITTNSYIVSMIEEMERKRAG